jgi:hypothetical protein
MPDFKREETFQFDIRECERSTWKNFSKYHYLSENLPGGLIYTYGLYLGDNQVGFQCFANYTPPKKGQPVILHSNRTVIHPDYVGIGLGIKIIDETSKLMRLHPEGYRIMGKFSNEAIYQSMRKHGSRLRLVTGWSVSRGYVKLLKPTASSSSAKHWKLLEIH